MEAVRAVVADLLGVAESSILVALRTPLEHQSNRLYDVWADSQHFIAKEFSDKNPAESAEREIRSLKLLVPLDLAPRPVGSADASDDRGPVVLYEFLEGDMWSRHRPSAGQLRNLADAYVKINSIPPDGLWLAANMDVPLRYRVLSFHQVFDEYARWAEGFTPAQRPADLCMKLLEHLSGGAAMIEQARPVLLFCQTDGRFANIIERPGGRIGFVDWEDGGLRDPGRQIADLLMHPNQEDLLTLSDWAPFTEPYYSALLQRDPDIAERVHAYIPWFCIFWLALIIYRSLKSVRKGEERQHSVNELSPDHRLRRYLARALAWPDDDFSQQLANLADAQFFPAS